jgi:pimeloyl-ACP methyl ester carboxylesterase
MVVRECLQRAGSVWRDAFAALFDDDFATRDAPHRRADARRLGRSRRDGSAGDQERIVRAIEGSRLLTYEGAGHALHWEQPARFAGDLATFASTVASPALSEETFQ